MASVQLVDLVIPAGDKESNAIGGSLFDVLEEIGINAPGALAGTVTVEVSDVEPGVAVDADFRTLQSGGSDVVVTIDDTTPIKFISFRSLRLKSDTNTGAGGETYTVVAKEAVVRLFGCGL